MTTRLLGLAAAIALSACSATVRAQPAAPQVKVSEGVLAGVRNGDIVSYKGLPFAAPPVGELRWRPPQPPTAWAGVRVADKVGALCMQKYNAQDNGVGPLPMSEDCLTLNVFAPAAAKAAPVMFWIHGGGFVNGSGTAALYDGTALARQGIIVVTINYRLGRFGFFAHPALTTEAKGVEVGNYALMDMIAALKWVRANIARFGGDPKQVTIFGESAGGIAVNDLMVSSAAKGLFARAITESGLGREPAVTLSMAEKAGEAFASATGRPKASADDLRKLSADEILLKGADLDIRGGGGPIADGQILRMGPMEGFSKGLEAKVPYIVGFNSLEFPAQATVAEAALAGMLKPEQRTRLEATYPTHAAFTAHAFSDMVFNEPALALAQLHAANGHPTWVYQFSVVSPAVRGRFEGAPHASERQYVFQTLKTSPWPTDANDAAQAQTMSAYWAAFARTGDPNGAGRVAWPRYEGRRRHLLDFKNEGPVASSAPRAAAMDEITRIAAQQGGH